MVMRVTQFVYVHKLKIRPFFGRSRGFLMKRKCLYEEPYPNNNTGWLGK